MNSVDPISLLCDLIAIPSLNPMGRAVLEPPYGEARLAAYLDPWLRQHGLTVERHTVAPGQDNVLARLDGAGAPDRPDSLVLFDAHMDTVPVDGMRIDPFRPEVRDGRVYGRGACDVKGGMAAMLTALARLAAVPQSQRPTVVMACTVNEENGFSGAEHLVGQLRHGPTPLLPRKPDLAVIAEPTGLDVVVAHKGVVRWRCHARGKAAHSSRPESGENAIYKMAHALAAIERYQVSIVGRLATHALCGPATLSVGTIQGGVSVNVVPDRCTIEIDRRLPPGEALESARTHLIDYLARDAGLEFTLEHEPAYMSGPPLSDENNGPLSERIAAEVRAVCGECRKLGVPYGTDAAFFSQAGIPAVVVGPGHLAQAHTDSEWIAVDQMHAAVEVYFRFLKNLVA